MAPEMQVELMALVWPMSYFPFQRGHSNTIVSYMRPKVLCATDQALHALYTWKFFIVEHMTENGNVACLDNQESDPFCGDSAPHL